MNTSNVSSLQDYQGEQGEIIDGTVETVKDNQAVEEGQGVEVAQDTPTNEKPSMLDTLKQQDLTKVEKVIVNAIDFLQQARTRRATINGEATAAKSACQVVGIDKTVLPWAMKIFEADDDKRAAMVVALNVVLKALDIKVQMDWIDELQIGNAQLALTSAEENTRKEQEKLKALRKEVAALRKEKKELETA